MKDQDRKEERLPYPPAEGSIKIETVFNKAEIEIADLTPRERNALAGLMGFSSVRREAFAALRELKQFKKIRPYEVWATCPKKAKHFGTTVRVDINNGTEEGKASCALITDILPEAEASSAIHTVAGWCNRCKEVHSITRKSVLVKLTVEGIPFSNLYEV